MITRIKTMSKLQKGQSLVEYTVLVSVIAIAAIPIMTNSAILYQTRYTKWRLC